MDRAREAIAKSFLNKEENYEEELKYIDTKWESQLHQSWHAGDIIWIYKFIIQIHLLKIVAKWWKVCLIAFQGWFRIWGLKTRFLPN